MDDIKKIASIISEDEDVPHWATPFVSKIRTVLGLEPTKANDEVLYDF